MLMPGVDNSRHRIWNRLLWFSVFLSFVLADFPEVASAGTPREQGLLREGSEVSTKVEENVVLAQENFEKSQQSREEGNLHEAERYLKKALDLDPANANYHFELANIYALRHDASKKASLDPLTSEMLNAAARELEQATMLQQDFFAAHYNLGVVYKRQGRYEEARKKFKQVLKLDPKNAPAHMQIGATYEEQGFYEDAKEFYLHARGLDFTNPGIQASIEDLKERKEKATVSKKRGDPLSYYHRLRGDFRYTPFSQAAQYEARRRESMQAGSDVRQAIPFLGAWLIQEFMKLRENQE